MGLGGEGRVQDLALWDGDARPIADNAPADSAIVQHATTDCLPALLDDTQWGGACHHSIHIQVLLLRFFS